VSPKTKDGAAGSRALASYACSRRLLFGLKVYGNRSTGTSTQSTTTFSRMPVGLFVWLISHQPAVLFTQNKSAISNQPTVLFSQSKPAPAISHQPTEQALHLDQNIAQPGACRMQKTALPISHRVGCHALASLLACNLVRCPGDG
jgi:hypothetical protein